MRVEVLLRRRVGIAPVAVGPVQKTFGGQHGAGAPEDLQVMHRPIRVAEKGGMCLAHDAQVDPQPARGAVLQEHLGKFGADAGEGAVIAAVVLVQPVAWPGDRDRCGRSPGPGSRLKSSLIQSAW